MIVEQLTGDSHLTLQRATSLLLSHGAQFVEDALRDNPTGPVTMLTQIDHCDVTYEVVIGDVDSSPLSPRSRTIWHRTVTFGMTDRTHAGGADFVAATRAQEEVAWALVTLVRTT